MAATLISSRDLQDQLGYLVEPTDPRVDLISPDHRYVVELKQRLTSVRDLHAAALQLALYLGEAKAVHGEVRAILLVHAPRVTADRLKREWEKLAHVLRPELASHLVLVAFGADGEVVLPPPDPVVRRLIDVVRPLIRSTKSEVQRPGGRWDRKGFAVFQALFDAWLGNEPPLAIGELARRAGASHPTVAITLDRLASRRELERTSSRRASLTGIPRRSLAELVVLAPELRRTAFFADASGRAPDPEDLLKRVSTRAPSGVQIGGIAAARHYQPAFNLNGLPRVDVTVDQSVNAEWWRSVDPALTRIGSNTSSPLLVVHQSVRRPDEPSRFASPAETVFDLHSLRLAEQADDLVRFLRQS